MVVIDREATQSLHNMCFKKSILISKGPFKNYVTSLEGRGVNSDKQ